MSRNHKLYTSSLILGLTSIVLINMTPLANAEQISPNPNYGDINIGGEPPPHFVENFLDPFENYGTITIGYLGYLHNYGTIDNYGSITLGAAYDSALVGGSINNYGTIQGQGFLAADRVNNSGTLYLIPSSNIDILDNSGSLINSAFLKNQTLTNTGSVTNIIEISGSGTYTQLSGETINKGFISKTSINILGGNLTGAGFLTGEVNIGPDATVMPGNSPGKMSITGDLHSSGDYIIEIAGLNSGQYDLLDIDGNAFFTGGNFKFDFIDGFHPSVGDHWDFLFADSLSGWESVNFTFAGLGDGLGINLGSQNGRLTMMVITAIPEPETYAMLLTGLGLMGLMTYRRKQKEAA